MKNCYDLLPAESVKRSAVFFQKTGARGGNKRSRCLTALLCVLLTVCICFTGCAGRPAQPTEPQNTASGETDGTVSDTAQATEPSAPVSNEPEASLPDDTQSEATQAAQTPSSESQPSHSAGTDARETEPSQTTTAAPEPTQTEPGSAEPASQPTQPSETAASETAAQPTEPAEATRLITDGVYITEIFAYSGLYVEDGSNTPCTNVCAVRLRNDSDRHYQYLQFELKTAGGTYTFSATTLFAGAQMTVLCENGAAFTDNKVVSLRAIAVAPFTETPTVHTDTLEISYTDGFINVKNISDKTLTNVYIYYKNTDANGYLGGITYRTSFGDLAPGELKQSGASNMHRATGKVVFATYDH